MQKARKVGELVVLVTALAAASLFPKLMGDYNPAPNQQPKPRTVQSEARLSPLEELALNNKTANGVVLPLDVHYTVATQYKELRDMSKYSAERSTENSGADTVLEIKDGKGETVALFSYCSTERFKVGGINIVSVQFPGETKRPYTRISPYR